MGIDCGFDIYPPLEPTPSNKEKYKKFLDEVLRTYETDSAVCVESEWKGVYIEFMVGEHPSIPHNCEHFLRFSSKVSGSSTARPYIDGVHRIAKKWLGESVHSWHEMNETGDHRQWGYYDWDKIRSVRKMRVEQAGEAIFGKEEVGTSSAAGVALLGGQEGESKEEAGTKQGGQAKQENDR